MAREAAQQIENTQGLFPPYSHFKQELRKVMYSLWKIEWQTNTFPILHGAEMWKRGHNNLIRDALVFIPFS